MQWKQRITLALLTAGGLIAMMDAARVARQAVQPSENAGARPKPVWVAVR